MATITEDLAAFLSTELPAEDIRGGYLPTDPNRAIALVERTGDEPPAETFVGKGRGPKRNMESPHIQVMTRGEPNDYLEARALAEDVINILHNQVGVVLSGTRYAVIEALQSPFNLGVDEQGRRMSGFTVRCVKRPN